MSSAKRPSTSSLRRFIASRPYVPVAEIRRRFALDCGDALYRLDHEGRTAFVGLPDREALKLQELLTRNEIGVELSLEVRAPVVVGVFPMRIARYFMDERNGHRASTQANGHDISESSSNGSHPPTSPAHAH